MGNVVTVFTAEDKEILKSYQRQQQEADKLAAKQRAANKEAKADTETLIGGLGKMAMGWAGISVVIGEATKALGEYYARQKEIADLQKQTEKSAAAALASAGMLSKENVKFLANVQGATAQQATGLFGSVTSVGRRLSADDARDLTTQTARLLPAGEQFAGGVGQMAARLRIERPGLSNDDALDLATRLQQDMGDKAGELLSGGNLRAQGVFAKNTGMSDSESLAYAMNFSEAGLEGEAMQKLGTLAGTGLGRRSGTSAQDRAVNKASKLRGRELVEAVMADPLLQQAVFGEQAGAVGRVDMGKIKTDAASLEGSMRENFFTSEVGRIGEATGITSRSQSADSASERALLGQGSDAEVYDTLYKAMKTIGQGGSMQSVSATGIGIQSAFTGEDIADISARQLENEAARLESRSATMKRAGIAGSEKEDANAKYLREMVDILKQMAAERKKPTVDLAPGAGP